MIKTQKDINLTTKDIIEVHILYIYIEICLSYDNNLKKFNFDSLN